MIRLRRSEERGHANHGWLDTFHTFSFGEYHDPDFMEFSALRVLNQDRVTAGQGFGTHGHKDMEIVSYVLEGVLEHKDSMGNGSKMRPGDVQLMSAGTGVRHSEFNSSENDDLHFLQMWVIPAAPDTQPRYEQRAFSEEVRRGTLRLVVSQNGDQGSLAIGQDVRLYAGLLDGDETADFEFPAGRVGWLHVARGRVTLNGHELGPGDGAAIEDERTLTFREGRAAEVVLWDLPAI